MNCTLEFKRAIFNWEPVRDDYFQLYKLLQSKFESISEPDRKGLEEEIARSLKYMPNNRKNATALLFLQNKEFTDPCVSKSAPANVPTPDQVAKSVAGPVAKSVVVPSPDQVAKSVAGPVAKSVVVPSPDQVAKSVADPSIAVTTQRETRKDIHEDGLSYDTSKDALKFYGQLNSYYYRPPPPSHKDKSAFENKLLSGSALAYFHNTESGLPLAEYCLLMHLLNYLRFMKDILLERLDLQSLSPAKDFTNIGGSPKANTDLHLFTDTLARYFSNPDNIQRLVKNSEIAQMVAYYGVGLDFIKGLTASTLTDLIKGAKHYSRSGIIVPVYGIGNNCYRRKVFFPRKALHYADGIFGEENKFEILPFQHDLYIELKLKYSSLVQREASKIIIGRTFDDPTPTYYGNYDHECSPGYWEQKWKHMPNQGKPVF
jgi:hypothetical protein